MFNTQTVTYAKEAVKVIKRGNYSKIKTFFDNDRAGEETSEYFKNQLSNVQPQNIIYAQEKDLNAYLTKFKQSEKIK